jgi:hypothetical protein
MAKGMADSKRFWVCFDFGLRGSYRSFYEWLDHQGAEECGEGVATFESEKTNLDIEAEIKSFVDDASEARIYLISRRWGGKFVVGRRHVAPWRGFASVTPGTEVEA